jgi:hypothetical protein
MPSDSAGSGEAVAADVRGARIDRGAAVVAVLSRGEIARGAVAARLGGRRITQPSPSTSGSRVVVGRPSPLGLQAPRKARSRESKEERIKGFPSLRSPKMNVSSILT